MFYPQKKMQKMHNTTINRVEGGAVLAQYVYLILYFCTFWRENPYLITIFFLPPMVVVSQLLSTSNVPVVSAVSLLTTSQPDIKRANCTQRKRRGARVLVCATHTFMRCLNDVIGTQTENKKEVGNVYNYVTKFVSAICNGVRNIDKLNHDYVTGAEGERGNFNQHAFFSQWTTWESSFAH